MQPENADNTTTLNISY